MSNFMKEALKEAEKALKKEEVPIGAVIVKDGQVISRGHNKRENLQNAIKHAEIIAIEKACKKLNSWRLEGAEIYVTLEPCPMCAGAIANARIKKVIYGADDTTADDHLCEAILKSSRLNHKVIMEKEECEQAKHLLQQFFKDKRKHH